MPLKTFATKEEIPAELQAAAVETKEGKWIVEEVDPALGEAGKKALQAERDARKAAEDKAKAVERERDDLKREAEARKNGATEEELQKIRDDAAAARKPLEDELAATKAKQDELERENKKLKLTDRVQKLALESGVMEDRIEDAMLHLERRTRLGDQGGIIFLDKDGKDTADTADVFFPKFKIEKPWLFKGAGSSGGGAGDPPPALPPQGGTPQHASVPGRF